MAFDYYHCNSGRVMTAAVVCAAYDHYCSCYDQIIQQNRARVTRVFQFGRRWGVKFLSGAAPISAGEWLLAW